MRILWSASSLTSRNMRFLRVFPRKGHYKGAASVVKNTRRFASRMRQRQTNGLPAQKLYLVRNGMLENLVYSRFWAKQKAKEPTPGPVNAILQSAQPPASMDEMVRSTERGLLVSRFWYLRFVDVRTLLQTGLTRDGVWLIEKGKIQYPVRNFRFNQSLLEMLAPGNVELIGAPERVSSSESQGTSSALLPALTIKQFHFTSQSEAV